MTGRLVVITGTGTGIGKTHVAEALLLAWRQCEFRAAGLKPLESGVDGASPSDSARLAAASSFHVKPLYSLRTPVAPHLAARREGVVLRLGPVHASIEATLACTDIALLELPGGLFSPFTDEFLNADFAAALRPHALLLVAPDRLGVLHDVICAVRAAATLPVPVAGVLLVAPPIADSSTGSNAFELKTRILPPVLATVPRGSPVDLALSLCDLAKALAR
jgi:dethiobiotin synthetase